MNALKTGGRPVRKRLGLSQEKTEDSADRFTRSAEPSLRCRVNNVQPAAGSGPFAVISWNLSPTRPARSPCSFQLSNSSNSFFTFQKGSFWSLLGSQAG